MPDTPRTLSECIEAEREALAEYEALNDQRGNFSAEQEQAAREAWQAARAATDEAVSEMMGRQELVRERARLVMREVADYRLWGNRAATATTVAAAGAEAMTRLDAVAQLCDALWDTILATTPAPTAQGESTGGEGA